MFNYSLPFLQPDQKQSSVTLLTALPYKMTDRNDLASDYRSQTHCRVLWDGYIWRKPKSSTDVFWHVSLLPEHISEYREMKVVWSRCTKLFTESLALKLEIRETALRNIPVCFMSRWKAVWLMNWCVSDIQGCHVNQQKSSAFLC